MLEVLTITSLLTLATHKGITMEQITINYDQLDNLAIKAVTKNQEGYRLIIDAQAREIADLKAQLLQAKPTDTTPASPGMQTPPEVAET